MEGAKAAQWAEHVKRWKESGLTAKEFAAEAGLNPSTLSYWKWRLGKAGGSTEIRPGERRRRPGRRGTRTSPTSTPRNGARAIGPTFVEVSAVVSGVPAALELVLDGHMSVRVPAGLDEATLTRVVRAVRAVEVTR